MKIYRMHSSRLDTALWWATQEMAEDAFNRAARRAGLPTTYRPGDCGGDARECDGSGFQGVRNGHGMVFMEIRFREGVVVGANGRITRPRGRGGIG